MQPVFNELLDRSSDGEPWLRELWEAAALTRPGASLAPPLNLGALLPSETPTERGSRLGKVYERAVAPPAAFLRWLLQNPQAMQLRDPESFGAKSTESRTWRGKLFSADERLVREAQVEGTRQLESRLAQRGRNKWWAFEGFSHIDCCLITAECVVFVEGKRTDTGAASTLWFPQRSQLWRNVEAASEFAGHKQFAVILAVESDADGQAALSDAANALNASYPHLAPEERAALSQHLIGFVTWPAIVARFALPPSSMPETA